jgi:creatinine amidohydrolase
MTTAFPLCAADDATFWPWLSSPAIAAWPDKGKTVVVLPMAGLADWGIGHPLDAEECILLDVIRRASLGRPAGLRLLVLPPLRFVFGVDPGCAFALGAPAAHAQIAEVAASIVASGFRRIVLCNASPWNEEVCAAASRDLRVSLDAEVFRIHLSALGLDLHSARSPDRRLVQTVVTALLGRMPETLPAAAGTAGAGWGQEPVTPLGGTPVPLEQAKSDGFVALQAAATRLSSLLSEISGIPTFAKPSPAAEPAAGPPAAGLFPAFPPYRSRYLPAMTLGQIQALPNKERALVIVAIGAIEQHGPHLPVAVDSLMGQAWLSLSLARLPAQEPCYVAPSITVGKSNEHTGFAGTLMVSKDTLREDLLAIAFQVHAWGFRKLAVINTHGGNTAVVVTTLREIRRRPGLAAGLLRVDEELGLSAQESAHGMHAGEVETSWMLAAAPSLVRPSEAVCEYPARLEDPGQVRPELAPATFGWLTRDLSSSGIMGDATAATRAKGERWIELRANALARAFAGLCR